MHRVLVAPDAREIQTPPSPSKSPQPTSEPLPQLEESTAREDSIRNYKYAKEPSEKKKKGSKRKKNDEEGAIPPAITIPPMTSSLPGGTTLNASSKKKKDAQGDGSQKKKKGSSLKIHNNNNNRESQPNQSPGRPAEKSFYIEYSKCNKKEKSECKDTILGEEDLYPTTAPTAFDFKPGDVPSGKPLLIIRHLITCNYTGSSVQTKDQENKLQNSTRSDAKNLKSVMSNYAPL